LLDATPRAIKIAAMNLEQSHYSAFSLVRDMLATADVIANFNVDQAKDTANQIASVGKLHLTGEGSSRIFPAKHASMQARRAGWKLALHTDAGRQSQEYDLTDWAVLAASNSGKTSEVIKLFTDLKAKGHNHRYGLTASDGSKLGELSNQCYVLKCGPEGAVAATKSVVEQALFYHALLEHVAGKPALGGKLKALASHVREALTTPIDPKLTERISRAGTIYFAGRNDGVAEELTLKTNEITRKKSDYLEGTYAAHGIEEVMNADDVLIWVDPYEDAEQKFTDVLVKGVGLTVIAIADRPTSFPTIRVPKTELSSYVAMSGGWNLLVEVGMKLGINLDKPVRARKVGNEFVG
jgi:glucosamine--fructose-6-phosphate aminotransferase (isomerizing)